MTTTKETKMINIIYNNFDNALEYFARDVPTSLHSTKFNYEKEIESLTHKLQKVEDNLKQFVKEDDISEEQIIKLKIKCFDLNEKMWKDFGNVSVNPNECETSYFKILSKISEWLIHISNVLEM